MAEVVNNRVRSYNVISSPSKLLAQSGKYLVMGLAKGLTDNLQIVADAAMLLAKEPEKQIDSISDFITNVFGAELDDTITIRPVLDLTDVRVGANQIGAMLSNQQASLAAQSANLTINGSEMGLLVDLVSRIYTAVQNGSDVYLDGDVIAGSVNRRLGIL